MSKTILSENIRALYKSSGLSQAEFGAKFGSNAKNIWAYIHVGSKPNGVFLQNLCNHYNIDIDFLTNTQIRMTKDGDIANRPKYGDRVNRLKKRVEKLLAEHDEFSKSFRAELTAVVAELAEAERTKTR